MKVEVKVEVTAMRRNNRPSFEPGSIPNVRPPTPGLPTSNTNTNSTTSTNFNPHPLTAQQQRAAIANHHRRTSLTAYDALVANNPDPEAANFRRPSPPAPPGLPIPPSAIPSAPNGFLQAPAGTNGVASGGMSLF